MIIKLYISFIFSLILLDKEGYLMFANFSRKPKKENFNSSTNRKLTIEEQARDMMMRKKGLTLDEAKELIEKGQKSLDSFSSFRY